MIGIDLLVLPLVLAFLLGAPLARFILGPLPAPAPPAR